MITIRRSNERGHANHGWLDTYHTFSFAGYYDPEHMGFRTLRVLNDDVIQPGQGFGSHPHENMEIITYVIEGALEHKDNTGGGGVIRPGDVQRMSAGSGIVHSEFNHSRSERVHLLQVWIVPDTVGIDPGYEQKTFSIEDKKGRLALLASPDGDDGSLTIHQDARVYAAVLGDGDEVRKDIVEGRHAWVHVATGSVEVNGHPLGAGDSAAVSQETTVTIKGVGAGEVLLFDLA
jgi:redox-sensitive bicupin YhaK (pirin superfamily)